MIPPPEVTFVESPRVACDGASGVAAALGHPRQYIQIDDQIGFGECGYCDRRFVLRGGVADDGEANGSGAGVRQGTNEGGAPGKGMPGMDS